MSHEIDMSNNRANIAFVGEVPWHELGTQLTRGASIPEWTQAAGLAWQAKEAPVMFQNGSLQEFKGRKVLYRSDNHDPLSVVSDGYKVVQPAEIMDFFAKLADIGGFSLEVAGALSGGKRVWALAKVGDGAPVVDGDLVKPYLLLGTSYDGTMATVAKFTTIRVVCNNTITAAVGGILDGRRVAGEAETNKGYLKSAVRVMHSEKFNAEDVRLQLGIAANQWDRFLIDSRQLASEPMNQEQADAFVKELLTPYYSRTLDITATRAYRRVIELFNGAAMGSNIPGVSGTRWAMLNAVTELIDHERGRSTNTRIESAWFGMGAKIKAGAMALLTD